MTIKSAKTKPSNVWNRTGMDEMSKNFFSLVTSTWVVVGILVTMNFAVVTKALELNWFIVIGVLVFGIAGVLISGHGNPVVSFTGYMMVAVPFGILMGPVINAYTDASVVKVLLTTTVVVAGLGFVGAIIPDNLQGLGSWFLGGLIALLAGYFVIPIAGFFGVPIEGALRAWDWIGVALFAGLVVYDWNRAMRIPKTWDNSIDVAIAIYLDWLNIFIRLLSLTGNKKSD